MNNDHLNYVAMGNDYLDYAKSVKFMTVCLTISIFVPDVQKISFS